MSRFRIAVASGLIAVGSPALAHPGHLESGFTAGLFHPLTGIDHLLAMLMVGLYAGLTFRRHRWICPAIFVGFMLTGFAWGAAGGVLPVAELLILASLAVLGLAMIFDLRPPLALAVPIVALFAIGHGFAHGVEMPAGGDPRDFVTGFMVTTVLLHVAGLGLARGVHSKRLGQISGLFATLTAATLMWSS